LGVSHWLPHRPFALESRLFLLSVIVSSCSQHHCSLTYALLCCCYSMSLCLPFIYTFFLFSCQYVDLVHEMASHDEACEPSRKQGNIRRVLFLLILPPLWSFLILSLSLYNPSRTTLIFSLNYDIRCRFFTHASFVTPFPPPPHRIFVRCLVNNSAAIDTHKSSALFASRTSFDFVGSLG
jgi:hypothetical protein